MLLLRFFRRILLCGEDDEEQHSYDYRKYGNYSISPPIQRNISKPPQGLDTSVAISRYRDDVRPLLSPARSVIDPRGNSRPTSVTSHGEGNRTVFSSTDSHKQLAAVTSFSSLGTRSISSSVRAPAPAPAPAPSSKPLFVSVSSTNSNISAARLSVGPEILQVKKDSATCSHILSSSSSSNAFTLSSTKPSPVISSTGLISTERKPIGPEKLQISTCPATRTAITSDAGNLLLKFPSTSVSTSAKDSYSPAPQSKSSQSKSSLSSTFSSTDRSEVLSRVSQQITLDSISRIPETTSSLSSSLHSNRNSVSTSPLSKPSLTPVPTATISSGDSVKVWRKKKQNLTESNKKYQQNVPSSDSSSEASSSSSLPFPETRITNRRALSKYEIPKYLEEMIKKDILPPVLKSPLSPSTYRDYFATLLYAEDFYIEKWSEYLLKDVALELRPRSSISLSQVTNLKEEGEMAVDRDFVAFKIDSVPEKRPYLLSRDFVFLQPLNTLSGPFKGILFRVVKGVILVEFGDDFHSQHTSSKRYNISFSFNRVCLKRTHQAISVATDHPSFHSLLFPDQKMSPLPSSFHFRDNVLKISDPIRNIVNHKGPIPYLIQGRRFLDIKKCLLQAIVKIYRANSCSKILVCSPSNNTSDVVLQSLMNLIPEASFFRANAAFRDIELVPGDIVPSSLYEEEEERFTCPPLSDLLKFNVITCTFISSFRLHSAGIHSEHFSHIFLVDACKAIEPEAIVPLANLAGKNTSVVVTGSLNMSPGWVRSEIGRKCGLKTSYFNRLLGCEPYRTRDGMFFAKIEDEKHSEL